MSTTKRNLESAKRITISMRPSVFEEYTEFAQNMDIPFSALIRLALVDYKKKIEREDI
jgi:hypothetical protein